MAAFCDAVRTTRHRRAPSIGFDRSPEVERSTTERTGRAYWTTCQTKPQITILDRTSWTPEAAFAKVRVAGSNPVVRSKSLLRGHFLFIVDAGKAALRV